MQSDQGLDELATLLIANGSRFVRSAAHRSGTSRSLIALRALSNVEHEGGLRVGELAARECVAQPTMTGVVNRLEADGLVVRAADPDDARAAEVRISEAGSAVLRRFRVEAAAAARPALEALAEDDLAALARAAELLGELAEQLAGRP